MENVEKRPSITALFREGAPIGLQNSKHRRLFESLQWRQAYLNSDYYEYNLEESTKRKLSLSQSLRVKQIPNGEMKGLGTGTFVWPAAHVLAKYLEKRYQSEGLSTKRICDIGCGTGTVGLVSALLGGTVVLTDLELLLPLIQENINATKEKYPHIQISSAIYNWENKDAFTPAPFDVLLISDCVLPKLYPIQSLVDAVDYLLTDHTIAFFSYEHRPFPEYDPRQEFSRLCSLKGLEVHLIPMNEHHSTYCAEDIELWEVIRRNDTTTAPPSSTSNVAAQRKGSKAFELKDWGEDKAAIHFIVKGKEYSVRQISSMGVGGAIWPSSVICSRKIAQKDFQELLAEKLFSSLSIRYGYSSGRALIPRHRSFREDPPRWTQGMLELKKKQLDFRGITVLDLGAGCGLASIVFHALGFNVIATDKLAIMNILEENVHHYLETCEKVDPLTEEPFLKILPFDWELEHDSFKLTDNIDFILCSDCLYNSIVVEPLIRVIQMNVKKELIVLLVNELRTSLEEFLYLIRHYDAHYEVTVEEVLITEPELELIRTNESIKFAPPIRMCFIKFMSITHSNSFDDISEDNPVDNFHRQSSESLERESETEPPYDHSHP